MNQTLLNVRKEMKERKPEFIRQDNPKRMKLNYKWRKPKGVHSKIRHHFKGRRKMPSPGFKSPAAVRGLHSTGLEMVKKARELDVRVLNLKIDEAIQKIENFMKSKSQKKTQAKKEEKKLEAKEKPKEKSEEKMTDEQRKESDKKERDKVLTQKD